jgi:molybdopterin synthase sulfur carrier subunit
MPIRVKFFATLRDATGKREVEIDAQGEGMDILNLMCFLFGKLGDDFKRAVLDPETGNIRRYIKIMVNGRDIELLNRLETLVKKGDVVQVFPPIGGG